MPKTQTMAFSGTLSSLTKWSARGLVIAGALLAATSGALAATTSGLDARPSNTTCLAGPKPVSGGVQLKQVWPELGAVVPFAIRNAPDNSAFYVVSRQGQMYRFNPGHTPVLVLDLSSEVGLNNQSNAYTDPPIGSENWGLVSFAFDPNFATNGRVFVLYNGRKASDPYTISQVARYTLKADRSAFDPASRLQIISQPQPSGYLHHFGDLAFGPDGDLYVGSGDGTLNGPEFVASVPAQDLSDLRGKILRLDVRNGTSAAPYAIPADNPWKNVAGARPEIYALGVRNPWRFSFDAVTGDLWLGDVGEAEWEEVDVVPKGANLGWNAWEANQCRSDYAGPGTCASLGATAPAISIAHNGKYMSVTGGIVYRGSAISDLYGKYIFALYGPQELYSVTKTGTQYTSKKLLDTTGGLTDFFTDSNGEIYGLDPWAGKIFELVPGDNGNGTEIPQLLSETGCVRPYNHAVAKVSLIPYSVNSPLWSDGAGKKRWAALPNGKTIDVLDDGDFSFPVGSVLMKNFMFKGKPFETRLLKRHDDGTWAGYTYQWNSAGTDATLVPSDGLTIQVRTNQGALINWKLPSRGECLLCHTAAANYALGPEIAQLNGNFHYNETGRTANQVTTWDAIGMFSEPLSAPVSALPALADYNDASLPTTPRARAYLHANCSFCHRPENITRATMDLRFETPVHDMNVCGIKPNIGDLGIADAQLLYPQHPELSIIPVRMRARGDNQMPPLGTVLAHFRGYTVVENWIRRKDVCQ
ncbi:MAG: PQQ-dependent sugar dehydrogenase [Rhodospirillales bacterium]|nr:PQQ-dependent sugar dehydrogenase [Rhodospirillales bacterium]